MKLYMRILYSLAGLVLFINTTTGQSLNPDYRVAIGLRAGETSGITFKYNMNDAASIELIGGIWSNWLSLTCLYERKAAAFNVEGLRWYYGAGGHFASSTGTYYDEGRYYPRGDDYALGIDGIVGLEYKIPPIPFAVSLDIKPLMEIYRNGKMYLGFDPGIGVKFTF